MPNAPAAQTEEIPYYADSCGYFEQVRHMAYPLLLDSNAPLTGGRFDIVTAAPAALIDTALNTNKKTGKHTLEHSHQIITADRQPAYLRLAEIERVRLQTADVSVFENIEDALAKYTSRIKTDDEIPFIAGAIGVFSYNFGMGLVGVDYQSAECWPEVHFGIYQWAIIQDHQRQQSWLVADPKLHQDQWQHIISLLKKPSAISNLNTHIAGTKKQLITPTKATASPNKFTLLSEWIANQNKAEYSSLFVRAMEYIRAGDCYQINLSQRFEANFHGDPWQAYKNLRKNAATPFAAYIERPEGSIASFSPERFISVQKNAVVTQPIKGTRPRGATTLEDAKLMAELSGSTKDRAENLMIVDLLRNDLGKYAQLGSIAVPSLFQIETHPNVHHMVSTITAKLTSTGASASLNLLKHCLPGGSVTGAPKKRAMEIINELEPNNRSIYCGSIVYIDGGGNMDSNILIRSLLFENQLSTENAANTSKVYDDKNNHTGSVYCWGGGGIVSDSELELEYEESLHKIRNILSTLEKM